MNFIRGSLAFFIYFPVCLMLLAMGIQNLVPVSLLVSDVFTIADIPAYFGLVSNLGAFVWCFSASVALFGWSVFRALGFDKRRTSLFLSVAGLSFLMMLDDFFMLHERFFQTYFGIPEQVTLLTYSLLFLGVIFFYFRKEFVRFGLVFLLLTFLFLGMSVFLDFLQSIFFPDDIMTPNSFHLAEEGFKFLGIFSWGVYIFFYCYQSITSLTKLSAKNLNLH